MAEYIGRLHRTTEGTEQRACTLNDLIGQLIKIRDERGNLPVVRTSFDPELADDVSKLAAEGWSPFGVVHTGVATHLTEAVKGWDYNGEALQVQVEDCL